MHLIINRLDELPCLILCFPCLKSNSDNEMLRLLAGASVLLSPSALQAVAADQSALRAAAAQAPQQNVTKYKLGEAAWTSHVKASITCRPLLSADNETLYVGTNASVLGINAQTGTQVWSAPLSGAVCGLVVSPVGGDRVYATSDGGQLYSLNAGTGQVVWTYVADGALNASATISRDGAKLFVATSNATVHAVEASTGAKLWAVKEGTRPFVTKPVSFHNGSQVMVGHGNGGVLALNGTNGHKVWEVASSDALVSRTEPLLSADKTLLFVPLVQGGTAETAVVALAIGDGHVVWRHAVSNLSSMSALVEAAPHPVTATDKDTLTSVLYALSSHGDVTAINTRGGLSAVTHAAGRPVQGAKQLAADFQHHRMYFLDGDGSLFTVDLKEDVHAASRVALPSLSANHTTLRHAAVPVTEDNVGFVYVTTNDTVVKLTVSIDKSQALRGLLYR